MYASLNPDITRVDDYAKHLKDTRSFFPNSVRYLVADGYYYRSKFWDAVRELNLDFIGKLRVDANLRYLYTGEQKKLGAPRKYDGKNALLFSTDIHLSPEQIIEYYQARFQIEFVFRDAKQFTGLSDCQSPHPQRLDFHFNASLTSLNLAKYQAYNCH
ncbi:transposase, partial [Kamptonema sp. UHCC 0994]|uniref:transposase n=1 Tax=Kamptonema sp. UHCC 0994 TaxID=3031329 RepID=UPI0023B960D4